MRPFGIKHLSWFIVGVIAVGGLMWVGTRKASRPDTVVNQVSATATTQENGGHFTGERAAPGVATKAPLTPLDSRAETTAHPDVASGDTLSDQVASVVKSGKFDLSVVESIQALPKDAQPALATDLTESPHPAMRYQAFLILKECPPDMAAEGMRKLLSDKNLETAMQAAAYLAGKASDAEARALLLKNATDADPFVAAPAIQALGALNGDDEEEALLKLLRNTEAPKSVLLAAIAATGSAKATKSVPALVKLLDDTRPRQQHDKDTARICDLAAAALEGIYGINKLDKPGAFFTATVEERNRGLAAWKAWYANQTTQPDADPRLTHRSSVVEASLKSLADSPGPETRARVKNQLESAFTTRFCLGDLPGADAVISPAVRDLWRILQICDEGTWYRHLNSWSDLQIGFDRQFLSKLTSLPQDTEGQALAFIMFARTVESVDRIWIWSFCRNFVEVFPASQRINDVRAIQSELEAAFAQAKMQVVLHGHIAVLEPRADAPKYGKLVPTGYTALHMQLQREPSNWSLYGPAVEYYKKWHEEAAAKNDPKNPPYVYDVLFKDWITLYPGNEWPYLGNAIYQWRVLKNSERAFMSADKALILNPDNAKAYAVRGMIRVVEGKEPDKAIANLTHAYALDPKSLGDEPETHAAIALLIEKALEAKDIARAKEYLKTLGSLRAFGSDQPFQSTDTYAKLAKVVEGAATNP